MAADGTQHSFPFPRTPASRLRPGEIVVDLFAGGGGASTALEQALGRPVDVAINHNPWAVSMHAANHPLTTHLCEDVWAADPRRECAGKPVGWLHASPDCTHFSQAKGGQPRSRATRSLSWVVLRWAGAVRPRIISLENVKEILKWGPLVAKRDRDTGRVVKLDGSIAAHGERVPIDQQFLIPDKRRAGRTWRHFVAALRRLGYAVEWRRLKACDYGAGTSRERLFLVARRDGAPIQWPAPTHGPGAAHPHVPAAACIDWGIPCPSIFERKRPLADATLRRIARGVKRYVLDAAEPFIVESAHGTALHPRGIPQPLDRRRMARRNAACAEAVRSAGVHPGGEQSAAMPSPILGSDGPLRTGDGSDPAAHALSCAPVITEHANSSNARSWRADEPLRTQCAGVKGGHFALAAATLVQTGYGERAGQEPRSLDLQQPLGTVVAGGVKHAVASASLVK
ncbi:MAG TPA: DNA cytosine methyltransferase, partial [Thermomonas sp.]|nr:DNA cytosine methyltransferase [Thermomonas sp.]